MGNIINTAPCRFCGQMVQNRQRGETDTATGRGTGDNVLHLRTGG